MVRVYLNVGTDSNPLFSTYSYAQSNGSNLTCTSSGCMGCFPRVVYWDLDDRKDLLLGQADGTVKIYLNTGTDAAPTFDKGQWLQTRSMALDVGERATPDILDWNNDGLTDLVVGGRDGYIHIYLNSGSTGGIPPSFDTMFSSGNKAMQDGEYLQVPTDRSSPVIMDFDGDGNTEGQLLFYQNIGTDESPLFSGYSQVTANGVPIDLSSNMRSRPSVCYWNGNRDGYLDVLIGYGDGKVHLYRGKPAPGDLDGDGDIDSSDFALFALCWFGPATGDCADADLSGDGVVDFRDLQVFADVCLAGVE
jgi:hypothetical protein